MIIPAILEKTPHGFAEKMSLIQTLKTKVKSIQVDFCDGLFVPSETLSIHDFAEIGDLSKKYSWEAHLMIIKPQNFVHYKEAGFSTIILHYEAYDSETHLEDALDQISKLGMKPAIAMNPETPVSILRYFTDTIKQFTILSVEPGKQGNPFIPGSIERVKTLRNMAPNATIEVDGGINATNAAALLEAGADCLAVGSALFETENIKTNYQTIESAGSHTKG
jgi:ribulose-phosphate 3-epimerase